MEDTLIRNEKALRQPIDYVDILKAPLAPTDIDGIIEWKNHGWIILECKQVGKDVPYGQKLMYERLIQALSKDKPAICLVYEHNETDYNKPIKAANCLIREYYARDEYGIFDWVSMKKDMTLKDYIPKLIRHINVVTGLPEDFGDFLIERG